MRWRGVATRGRASSTVWPRWRHWSTGAAATGLVLPHVLCGDTWRPPPARSLLHLVVARAWPMEPGRPRCGAEGPTGDVPPAAVMEAAPPPTRGLSTSPQASPLRLGGAGSPQDRFTPAVCTPDREVQAQTPPPPPPGWHLQEKGVGPAVDPRWNPNTTPRWCWACPCPLPSDLRPLGPTPFPLLPASCPLFCAPTSCCPRPGSAHAMLLTATWGRQRLACAGARSPAPGGCAGRPGWEGSGGRPALGPASPHVSPS